MTSNIGHFAAAEIGDVHAFLDPLGIVDRLHAVRARGEDVDAAHRLARTIDRAHFDFEPPRHVPREGLAVRRGGAIDLAQADVAHALESFEEGARHATRAEHAHGAAVLAREIFDADPGAAADPEMLEHAVVDERERLGVAG